MAAVPSTELAQLRAVTDAAAEIFTAPPRRYAADAYIRRRGIDPSGLSADWVIGYAPPGWTRLVDELRGQFSDQALIDAGVATMSSRGTLIDTFRHRVIFGVRDASGRIAGFIGRDLSGDPRAPKYLNSRLSEIFDKRSLLYGLHENTRTDGSRHVVVVEGPLDVLAIASRSRDAGLQWAPVAPAGTSFTMTQTQLVTSACGGAPVSVAMDGDDAGRDAALQICEQLRIAGAEARIIALPDGVDPTSFLARGGDIHAFQAENGLPPLAVRLQSVVARLGDRMHWIEGRLVAVRSVAAYLTTYSPDHAARQIMWLSGALGLDESTVTRELIDAFSGVDQTGRPMAANCSPGLRLGPVLEM
jgi:DNA primase